MIKFLIYGDNTPFYAIEIINNRFMGIVLAWFNNLQFDTSTIALL